MGSRSADDSRPNLDSPFTNTGPTLFATFAISNPPSLSHQSGLERSVNAPQETSVTATVLIEHNAGPALGIVFLQSQ